MNTSARNRSADPLEARSDDAHLTVYGLTEFVFCPRAGLCTHEQKGEIEDRETLPSASYLPMHDPVELELTLQATLRQTFRILFGGIASALLLSVMAVISGWLAIWGLAGIIVFVTFLAVVDRLRWILTMRATLRIWAAASPKEPDPKSTKIQYVHWCELKAVFSLTEPQGEYNYSPWKLGGKPWRLLEKGDLRIPVFKPGRPWKDLYPQHFVRMAAYCRLIEMQEGFKSPYGVIVMPDSFQAIIVPCSDRSQEDFERALIHARQIIRDAEEHNDHPGAPDAGRCRDCHHGQPRVFHNGEFFLRGDMTLTPKIFLARQGKQCHCHCGDRFKRVPPHELVDREV